MCDPVTIAGVAVAVAAASVATSTATAVAGQQSRKAQAKLAKENAEFQRIQIRNQLAEQSEADSQKKLELARAALVNQGKVQSANLGDRSIAAMARSIGFDLGQDQATVERNSQIAARQASARLRGVNLTQESQLLQIGDTSGALMGLQIGSGVLQAAGTGLSTYSGLSDVFSPSAAGGSVGDDVGS